MNPAVRFAALAVVVVTVIGGTFYMLGRIDGLIGGPPSAPPTAVPTPSAAVAPVIVAKNIEFDPLVLQVAARQPFTITLRNEDPPSMPHTIEIRSTGGAVVESQESIVGGTERAYQYAALQPGTYEFICAIHPIPGMTGTLRVR